MLTDFQEDLRNGMTIDDALRKYNISLGVVFNALHKKQTAHIRRDNIAKVRQKVGKRK